MLQRSAGVAEDRGPEGVADRTPLDHPGRGGHEAQLADAEEAAAARGVSVKPYRVASFSELEPALAALVDDRMNGLLNFQGGLSLINRKLIVAFAAKHGLPAIYQATLFAEIGGLMAWAPDLEEQFRIAASYVNQILRGATPGDLPIRSLSIFSDNQRRRR